MSTYIVNAAPMVIDYGTQDLSTRALPRQPEAVPQHLAKFYLFAQKGPTTPQLVSGVDRINMYGDKTFDLRGKYANHSTVFANALSAENNALMIERLIPDDAGPEANLIFWLDVLETQLDAYERDINTGEYARTSAGEVKPKLSTPVNGYLVKWVVTHRDTVADSVNFGRLGIANGDQTDLVTGKQSKRYPIFELVASSKGEYGNLCGVRFWAPNSKTAMSMPLKMMAEARAYPMNISLIRKKDARATPDSIPTIFGERTLVATLKPGSIDPDTDKQNFIGDVLLQNYQNLTDLRYPPILGDFGKLSIYNDNIKTLLTKFHAAEIAAANRTPSGAIADNFLDFTESLDDIYLFNILSGTTSNGAAYRSFQLSTDANSVVFSEYMNLMAKGGSDGTMNDMIHAELVSRRVRNYADPLHELQDMAVNVESVIYDTGFPVETKKDLISFISTRKDTFVVLGTYAFTDDHNFTASEEHSRAIGLRTMLQMYPESDYFGTPTMRGMIVGRSGVFRNSLYTKRLPLTLEVAIKAAKYMGADNGRWKNGKHFDGAPGSIVDNMTDISITWVPASVRNRNWDVGLNWVQAYDRRSFHFPALKTVYADDTSVLNSFFTSMAICELNKIAHAAWREFTGVSNLTPGQLVQRVNDFVISRTQNRFDNRFVIVPDANLTEMDRLRGYSWTLPIKIYANNMRTVMTTFVQAYRMEDYDGK